MIREQIKLNERASLNRPAWSSESSTGLWNAYRHLHTMRGREPIVKNYFDKTRGLMR